MTALPNLVNTVDMRTVENEPAARTEVTKRWVEAQGRTVQRQDDLMAQMDDVPSHVRAAANRLVAAMIEERSATASFITAMQATAAAGFGPEARLEEHLVGLRKARIRRSQEATRFKFESGETEASREHRRSLLLSMANIDSEIEARLAEIEKLQGRIAEKAMA